MRKWFLVKGLFLITLLMGCSESDPKPEPPAFSLEGTWVLANITATGCFNPDLNGNNSNYGCPPATEGFMVCDSYTFTGDGDATVDFSMYSYENLVEDTSYGTYSLTGHALTITLTSTNGGETTTTIGTASLSGSTLTILYSKHKTSGCVAKYTLIKVS